MATAFNKRNRPWVKLKDLYLIAYFRKHYRLWRKEISSREENNEPLGVRLYLLNTWVVQKSLYLTPANLLSLLRALLAFPFFVLLDNGYIGAAAAVYVVMVLTDFFDGPLARGFYHVTKSGEYIDPFADKCGTAALIFGWRSQLPDVVFYGIIGTALSLLFLASIAKPLANALGVERKSGANNFGKWKFAAECAGFIVLFLTYFTREYEIASHLLYLLAISFLSSSLLLAMASIIEHAFPGVLGKLFIFFKPSAFQKTPTF
jgi:CDP-diacylglycerol--glycerol-3-phosphate 3-phosphatidyltransferase/cardiolipin synthase